VSKKLENDLRRSRRKLELAFKNIIEKEKLANFYKYYANYYWVKSSDLQIRIWLKELDDPGQQKLLFNNKKNNLNKKLDQIENSLIHIIANLKKCDDEATEKKWKLRFLYSTIHEYIRQVYKNSAILRRKIKNLKTNL
jgi:hypothetical protein